MSAEKIRTALAMQDAGYHAPFDYRDVAALLEAYDVAVRALRAADKEIVSRINDNLYAYDGLLENRDIAGLVCQNLVLRQIRAALPATRDMEASNG